MTRSPDDIFAAQFWAWPDPALKRDAHGRVLFVNAAFLQLFGGSVEAWRGQVIQGWAAPQPGPQPNRFEIRMPAANGYPEQVYDWLEQCGPDGSAFALARNVTAFLAAADPLSAAQPLSSQPAHSPMVDANSADAAPLETHIEVAAPVSVTEPEVASPVAAVTQTAPIQNAPLQASPANVPDIEVAAPAVVEQPAMPAQPEPVTAAPAGATVVEVNPHAISAEQSAASVAEVAEDRDFERRALPIENGDALLGNNWRDAVIAKAVGGEAEVAPGSVASAVSPSVPSSMPMSAPSGAPVSDPTAQARSDGDAIRILLAEDNAINALLTRTLLEADGHSVDTVEDGMLAVEAMKTKTYDMIFMDMRMPNMDGLEATRKIRALTNVSKDLPIVALTANAFDDDRNACFDSGMNDFMTKPVSAEELSEMVVRWTSGSEQKLAS